MAAAAIAAVVWLALSYRSERLESRAGRAALEGAGISAAEAEQALSRAREARTVQPDAGPKLLEWLLLDLRGRDREALPLLEEIVREEPANARAWFLLAEHARDPALEREARRRFRELRPSPPRNR
jgi:predicted Zn-dependent protease